MTDIIEVTADETVVNKAIVLAALSKAVAAHKQDIAAELATRLSKGDKKTAHTPNGEPLGTVSMTDPAVVVQVTDPEKFESWIHEHYADKIETRATFDHDDAIIVLLEHAPELVTREEFIPDWLRANVIKAASVQDIPGTTRHRPDGTVQLRPNANAQAIVAELLAGSPMLAIEGEK